MKKLIAALCTASLITLVAQAADTDKKPELTAEQKAQYKQLVTKYDENKDGKLNKAERAKMSAEDLALYEKLHPTTHKSKTTEADKVQGTNAAPSAVPVK